MRPARRDHRGQREGHHRERSGHLLDEGEPTHAVWVRGHDRKTEFADSPVPVGDQQDAPEPPQQQRHEDGAHDIGVPHAAKREAAVRADGPRQRVVVQRGLVDNAPGDGGADHEYPGHRSVAKAAHIGDDAFESRTLFWPDESARFELRRGALRGLLHRPFREDEQRDRKQAANVDPVVLKQRLARVRGNETPSHDRPHGDRQPSQQCEEPGTAASAKTRRRYEVQPPEPAQRRLVVDGRERGIRLVCLNRGMWRVHRGAFTRGRDGAAGREVATDGPGTLAQRPKPTNGPAVRVDSGSLVRIGASSCSS